MTHQRARPTAQLFSFGDTRAVPDHGHRPRGRHDRLRAGQDDLRPRPRQPRPPDHLADRLHRHDHHPGRRRARRRGEHLRRLRRRVHRQRRPDHAHASTSCSRGTGRPSTSRRRRASTRSTKTAAEGGKTVGDINNGDWIAFDPYMLNNATSFTARVSSGGAGGTLQLRAGSPTGTSRLGHRPGRPAAGRRSPPSPAPSPAHRPAPTTLYLMFAGGAGALFDLDAFTFDTGTVPPQPDGRVEAESYTSQSGVQVVADGTAPRRQPRRLHRRRRLDRLRRA